MRRENNMKTSHKSGFSLIEIMVSMLVLVALVLGGAAVMYQTGGGIQRQQNKREAIVAANRTLESYWNTTYANLGLQAGSPIPTAQVVNGNTMQGAVIISPETTDVTGIDNYHRMQVSITLLTGETVVLESRRYKRGLSKAAVN